MLSDDQTAVVMSAIAERIEEHSNMPGFRYSQTMVNAGREAGASIEHPHGQLLGMSFVPRELVEEQAGFARFAGRCLLCTTVDAEENVNHRVVYADERVLVLCPFWSGVPYEMMVIPRAHGPHLHHSPETSSRPWVGPSRSLSAASAKWSATSPTTSSSTRPLPGSRAVPLARPHRSQAHHGGRLRARDRGHDQHLNPEEAAEELLVREQVARTG